MKPLRILFISEYFYPRMAGGEVWSWELCTALAKQGHDITIITSLFDHSPSEEVRQKMRILRPVRTTANEQQRLSRKAAANRLLRYITTYLHDHASDIDVVHVMAYALNTRVSELAKKYNIPCVTSAHSYFGEDWKKITRSGSIIQWMEKRALQRDVSTILQVPSRYLQKRIQKETSKKSVVIHNWLPSFFPPPKKLPAKTILFVGSLEPVKNPLACISVAKQLNAPLCVIGKGSLANALQQQAKHLVSFTHIPHASHAETLAYIRGASLVLVPSITESFSMVALEAVAQGTPVSGTRVGILPELPRVSTFPPKAFIPRIPVYVQRSLREKFSKEKAIEKFVKLYHAVANKE